MRADVRYSRLFWAWEHSEPQPIEESALLMKWSLLETTIMEGGKGIYVVVSDPYTIHV